MNRDNGLPIEQFIQALASQLDTVQEAMAVKVRAGLPLTFAVKDLSLDLRAYVEMEGSAVHIRPAGPSDTAASTLRLSLTTITRPMIDENTRSLSADVGEPTLKEVLGDDLTEDDRRRLEWAGIRSVSQLREVQRSASPEVIGRVSQLPVDRLRMALENVGRPRIRDVSALIRPEPGPPELRIRGDNLASELPAQVRIEGRAARVRLATPTELVVEPPDGLLAGSLDIETEPGAVATAKFDARPATPPPQSNEAGGAS
jgi:hypothetical protein